MSIYTGTMAATSNRVRWKYTVEVIDPLLNTDVNLTGSTIIMGIRDFGAKLCRLTGSLGDGHAILTSPGKFDVSFTAEEMKQFEAGTYEFGLTLKLADGTEHQLLAAELPIIDGIINP